MVRANSCDRFFFQIKCVCFIKVKKTACIFNDMADQSPALLTPRNIQTPKSL